MPVVLGALVLAGVVAIGAAPRFVGGGVQPSSAPLPAASLVASPAPASVPIAGARPSYPPPAVVSSTFWVEIRRNGHLLQRFELHRQPDESRTGTIPIPIAWRGKLPAVVLLGRTAPGDSASRLFSINLAIPEPGGTGAAVNLAGGVSVVVDPMPAPTGSFDPGPIVNFVHAWSYSADLSWVPGDVPRVTVTVAPQLGI